jgi:hypothetical protein
VETVVEVLEIFPLQELPTPVLVVVAADGDIQIPMLFEQVLQEPMAR